MTRQTIKRQIDVSASYRINTEANDFEFGGSARLKHPTDVAVDDEGTVYIVDFGNRRITRFVPISKTG